MRREERGREGEREGGREGGGTEERKGGREVKRGKNETDSSNFVSWSSS